MSAAAGHCQLDRVFGWNELIDPSRIASESRT
jgi:hypothetical protein